MATIWAAPAAAQQTQPIPSQTEQVTAHSDGVPDVLANLYSFRIGYGPGGAIVTSQDSVNGHWTYSYDPFNRLAAAIGPGRTFTYAYDRNGNRWRQTSSDGQGSSPEYGFDTANNRIVGMTYDALGNIINDGVHTYTYDAENRLIKVDGGATAEYAYDALGRRVRKATANGSVAEYLHDLAGRVAAERDPSTGSWNRGEVYAANRHVATYAGDTTYFHHQDWLGTNRVTTLPDRTIAEQCTNLPFGDGLTCTQSSGTPPTASLFADYERDRETLLDHTWFREYSSAQGRWTTPDPYLGSLDPSNPQSLNRYVYVSNDPVRSRDPLGLYMGCIWDDGTTDAAEDDGGASESECEGHGGTWGWIDTVTVVGKSPRVDPVPVFPPSFWWIVSIPTGGGGRQIPRPEDFRIPTVVEMLTMRRPTCMSAASRPNVPRLVPAGPTPDRMSPFVVYCTNQCTLGASGVFPQHPMTREACEAECLRGRIGELPDVPHMEFDVPRLPPPMQWQFPPGCAPR